MTKLILSVCLSVFWGVSLWGQLLQTPEMAVYPTALAEAVPERAFPVVIYVRTPEVVTGKGVLTVQGKSIPVESNMLSLNLQLHDALIRREKGSLLGMAEIPVLLFWETAEGQQKRSEMLKIPVRMPKAGVTYGRVTRGGVCYRDCGNFLHIEAENLPIEPDSFYMAPDGAMWMGSGEMNFVRNQRIANRFFLIPDKNTKLVYDFGYYDMLGKKVKLGTDFLVVTSPPRPRITVWAGDSLWDGKPVQRNTHIKIALVPEEAFRERHPQDARYEMKDIEIRFAKKYPKAPGPLYLHKQKWPSSVHKIEASKNVRLPMETDVLDLGRQGYGIEFSAEELGIGRSGVLLVRIGDVERINVQNKSFPVPLRQQELWVEIPIK